MQFPFARVGLLLVLVLMAGIGGCQRDGGPKNEPSGQSAQSKQVTVAVTGMT